ncbi:MAG: 2-oxoglutarate dehydrogenase complex dihydrolipoyllysine-residue succinyltransferase [Pseudomonadota bacterium]|jgi:2-oxoglutarate dehydrogenase E2 component (dihydrolipoamide succinyltransferase)
MLVEVKIPVLSESVAEATLLSWHKREGEFVNRDENLVDVETDKVVLELPAPASGVLKNVLKGDGATVLSEEIVATIDTAASAEKGETRPAAKAEAVPARAAQAAAAPAAAALSPAVRKLVAENQLAPEAIPATGRGGRLTKGDVLTYLETKPASAEMTGLAAPALGERPEQRVPMTRLRARVAERLLEAQHTNAILTTFNEVNMQPVMALRARYKDHFEKEHKVKLGYMSFFVKAAVAALKHFPVVNASVDGSDIVYHGYYDIGVAVSSPRGLVVPILRNVDLVSFAEIEAQIVEFGQKAKDGKLALEELTGGTFSITNGGIFGSMMSTPIINPPQSAILGMHKIYERPVAENGQVVIRPMMYLALSYDHRIIDGREAVLFLAAVKEALEDPARLLLQV